DSSWLRNVKKPKWISIRDPGARKKFAGPVDPRILDRRYIGGKRRSTERRKTMKRNNWLRISVLLPIALRLAAAGQDVTPTDREKALTYLAETRKGVIDATKGLTEAQWKFKPAPDRWSAAEVVEHLVLIEDMVHGILAK